MYRKPESRVEHGKFFWYGKSREEARRRWKISFFCRVTAMKSHNFFSPQEEKAWDDCVVTKF